MELYFLKELFFRYDAFFNAANLVPYDVVGYWTYDNVIVVNLFMCSILAIFKYELSPFQSVAAKTKDSQCFQVIFCKIVFVYGRGSHPILFIFTFGLPLGHLSVGSEIETQSKVFANSTFGKVNLLYFNICSVIKSHISGPPIRRQY